MKNTQTLQIQNRQFPNNSKNCRWIYSNSNCSFKSGDSWTKKRTKGLYQTDGL